MRNIDRKSLLPAWYPSRTGIITRSVCLGGIDKPPVRRMSRAFIREQKRLRAFVSVAAAMGPA